MRFEIQVVMIASILSFVAAPGCSLVDEPADGAPAPHSATRVQADPVSAAGHTSSVHRIRKPTRGCSSSADCPALAHALAWCSPQGSCQYTCRPGFGDANQEAHVDGCECRERHGGIEQCDGADDDCDGRVDDPFAGGRVAAGYGVTCATSRQGALRCWGAATPAPGDGLGAVHLHALSVGEHHGCAVGEGGQVYCWGDNRYGQAAPSQQRRYVDELHPVALSGDFVKVAVGEFHSCALSRAGQVYCWGRNDYGQLGIGTVSQRGAPQAVAASLAFVDVTAGQFHSCAASAGGQVLCWGANFRGQAGQVDTAAVNVPSPVAAPEAFSAVSAGANHTCALTPSGRTYCWGDNEHGQLGDGTRESRATARALVDEVHFTSVSAGAEHTCGLTDTGTLFCWGSNASGRLGLSQPARSSRDDGAALRPMPAATRVRFERIAAGGAHTCGLGRDHHLYCWGHGADGQLGGDASSSRSPRRTDCR